MGPHLLPLLRRICDVKLRQHQPDVLAIVLANPAPQQQHFSQAAFKGTHKYAI